MKKDSRQIGKYAAAHRRRKRRRTLVTSMAAVVVFCTVYALILPAITLEAQTYCGLEEHTHSAECYTSRLVCTLEEGPAHVHDDSCYVNQKTLICGLEESDGHTHDETCTQRTLLCPEDHEHTDACFETTYICGLAQSDPHHHTDACYQTERVVTCTASTESHTHTDSCYENALTCPLEAHTHTLACYSDPEADVETAAKWEKSVSKVELTGNWAADLVTVAESQRAYEESTKNYRVETDEVTGEEVKKGYTRYGAWYNSKYNGDPYGDWSAMYLSFCLEYAGVPEEDFPREAATETWRRKLSGDWEGYEDCHFYTEAENHTPAPGQIVFLDENENQKSDRVVLITELTYDETEETPLLIGFKTIGGDVSLRSYPDAADAVDVEKFELDDSRILGYATLPENPDKLEDPELVPEQPTLTEEEAAQVNDIIARIDALPTLEELREALAADTQTETANTEPENIPSSASAFSEAEGEPSVSQKVAQLYSEYCSMTEQQQEAVTNSDKLLSLAEELGLTEEETFFGKTAHTHSETCYDEAGALTCASEAHTHTLACYSDPAADVESEEIWASSVSGAEITGFFRDDLLAVANTQLGYTESAKNYQVQEDGETTKGYTRYGHWYGGMETAYDDWSAVFVSFCLNYAQIPEDTFPRSATCPEWIAALESLNRYTSAEGASPEKGDLVFFDNGRVGIVSQLTYAAAEETDPQLTGFACIQGDIDGAVAIQNYTPDDAAILGYGKLPKWQKSLVAEGEGYTITVRYTDAAELPEDIQLKVREIPSDTDEYKLYATQAAQFMKEKEGQVTRRFFDITLVSGEGEAAEEVEPAVPVNVTISLAEAQPTGDDTIVHFPNEGGVETLPATVDENGVHYEQPSFSIVALAAATSFPAKTYSQTAELGENFTYSRVIRVGDTVTITVGNGGSNFSWGTAVITPNDGYVSASTSGRTLTISGLQNSGGNTVKIELPYTYRRNNGNERTRTITVNLTIVDANEAIITSNHYRHLDVDVDADFKIYIYNSDGTVQVVNPSNTTITSINAKVYHTRPSDYDTAEKETQGNNYYPDTGSVAQEWANMANVVGTQTNGTTSSVTVDNKTYHAAVYSYTAQDTFNDETVSSYEVIFEPDTTYDSATQTTQYNSEGRSENSKASKHEGTRWPLALFDGDTVVLDTTISYSYNGKTYSADYEVITVIDASLNKCAQLGNQLNGRGFDMEVEIEDIVEVEATSVKKVDQYGDPVSGATLAVYATNENYEYYLDGDSGRTVDLSSTAYTVDKSTGVITVDSGTITPKFVETTDSYGNFTFDYQSGDLVGTVMSMTDLHIALGDYFVIREISVPSGYRTVSDEIKMKFEYAGTSTAGDSYLSLVMVSAEPYVSGVWASANANVMATETLYAATANSNLTINGTTVEKGTSISYYSTGDSGISSNGTLFAVVLKRNGRTLSDIDTWYPVYGSDSSGYTVLDTSGVDSVITAAKNGGATVFKKSASGRMMSASITNLPGDITRYYTYLLDECGGDYSEFLNTYENKETTTNSQPQYVVAYYYTTATADEDGNLNWNNVSNENTVRVLSHSGVAEGVNNESFTVHWGTTIEVPNMENRLFFQKRDEAKSTAANVGLIDNAVFALYPAVSAAQAGVENSNLCYYLGDDGENNTVYIIPYTPSIDGYDPENPYKAAVFGTNLKGKVALLGTGPYEFNKDNLSLEENVAQENRTGLVSSTDSSEAGLMTVTLETVATDSGATTGTQYYVHPATNAEGKAMVGYTHGTCPTISEAGTGHFNKLKTGNYLLREIAAPAGYALNNTDIPVVVNEIGVYANAGTETDGVSVGNGVGYLSKTLDVFASLNHIDETLAWVYGALLRSDATGFTAFNNVVHDVIHAESLEYPNTGWKFVKHVDGDLTAYGTQNADSRSEAMVSYFEYNGSLTNLGKTPIFDYTPNDDTGGQDARQSLPDGVTADNFVATQAGQTLNGAGLNRLWTKTGWSDMAIYQDYAYGSVKNPTTTHYTDLTSSGNISNLFSSSTFVTVTDQPIINEAQVDVGVSKIALTTVTNEDGTETTTPRPLAGAAFRLYKYDTNGTTKLYYKYTPGTDAEVDSDGNETAPAVLAKTEWVKSGGDTLTSIIEEIDGKIVGRLNDIFHNLTDENTNGATIYYLEETSEPTGYKPLDGPIQIAVDITQGGTDPAVVQVTVTYGSNTYTYDSSATTVETKNFDASGFAVASSVATTALTGDTAGFKGTYLYTITVPNQVKPVVNVSVNKVKEDGQSALAGAQFQLYRLGGTDNATKLYYKYTAAVPAVVDETTGEVTIPAIPAKTEWVTVDKSPTTLTSGETGTLNDIFHELEDTNESGATSYYLVETKAPDGYNLLTQPIKIDVEIAADSSATVEISIGEDKLFFAGKSAGNTAGYSVVETPPTSEKPGTYLYTITVPNSTGYELPNAGGPGTVNLALVGLALTMVGACGLILRRKRGDVM